MAKVKKTWNPRVWATPEQIDQMVLASTAYAHDPKGLRKTIIIIGITDQTYFHWYDLERLERVAGLLYTMDNKGVWGILNEIHQRVMQAIKYKRPLRWYDLRKRPDYAPDNKLRGVEIEDKSGAGDWLYSDSLTTRDEIIDWYRHNKKGFIRLHSDEYGIHIVMPWPDFFAMLDEYSPEKGCATFFNSQVVFKEFKYVVRFQTFSTSKRKIAWLVAHNCDMLNGDDK